MTSRCGGPAILMWTVVQSKRSRLRFHSEIEGERFSLFAVLSVLTAVAFPPIPANGCAMGPARGVSSRARGRIIRPEGLLRHSWADGFPDERYGNTKARLMVTETSNLFSPIYSP
jgi:hypothetical protein